MCQTGRMYNVEHCCSNTDSHLVLWNLIKLIHLLYNKLYNFISYREIDVLGLACRHNMDRGISFLILSILLLLLCNEQTTAQNQTEEKVSYECCSSSLNHRVSKLEAQNSNQKEEIAFLKTTVHRLNGKVARLEAAAEASTTNSLSTGKGKRPARLLPSHLFRYVERNFS